ncbi:MAG TPA: T9SS type A sorting domain-containing protein [Saprospiraceae bacterium]|nr:T9SS type A sorting domain-containing protein [Saprospiraceae bacterium]
MQTVLQFLLYVFLLSDVRETCVSPIITEATGQSTESIYISWLDFGNEPGTFFDLELVPTGTVPSGQPTVDSIAGLNTTVNGLLSGTEYDIYIRAVCPDGPSDWNGPVKAITYIANEDACGIALNIPDDNCPQFRSLAIEVNEHAGLTLGIDLFLSSVDLIVEHPWMADLTFLLRSPSGASALLMANHGVGVQHIGDPDDTTCTQVISFTMSACVDLTEIENGQTGNILPDASLNIFHDQGSAQGIWHLDVCDKASDDVGQLRFVQLNFTENACDFPPTLETHQVLDTTATLNGLGDETCDTLLVLVWNVNMPVDTMALLIECVTDDILIHQLLPGESYIYTAQKICGDHRSAWSCPQFISTTCDYISLWSSFDNNADCIAECSFACPLSDTLWTNSDQDEMDWTAFQGATPTEFTGPDGSRFVGGKYLYTETSGDECQDSAEAILISRCLRIAGSEDGCDLSFWYHMYGASTGSLILEISVDGGTVWEELLHLTGDKGDAWHEASVDLFGYNDVLAILRFRAISGAGFLGDIAVDDIMFFGSVDGTGIEICYYADVDMDGYGNVNHTVCLCAQTPPPGFTTDTSDCDDHDPEVSPIAAELPCNLRDDNCNGEMDEGVNPDPIVYIALLLEDASCTGINDGEIEIVAMGGLAPYSFQWSNGSDSSYLSGLSPGFYEGTITDANGCIAVTELFEIGSLAIIEYFIVAASDPSCIGQTDGFISGIVQGGSEPYTFLWSNGDTMQDATGLPDGMYQVTVTDSQGCWLVSDPVELAATSTISVNVLQLKHVSCHGGSNGSIRVIASGGAVPPFQYLWSNGDTTGLTAGLTAGSYTCTIIDSLGCMLVAGPYQITEPPALEVQVISAIPPLCNSSDDGSIQLSVNGGSPPYFYTWSHGAFSEDVFQLTAGEYSVTVADLHGCDTIHDILLLSPDMLEIALDTVIHVQCPGDSTGNIIVHALGGTLPYRYDWSTGATDSAQLDHLPTGFYSVTLSDASGCKSAIRNIEVVAINAPLEINFDEIYDVACHGDSSGFVVASVVGSPGPFWFNWSAGTQHTSIDGIDTLLSLPSGSYQVTITDANGCIGTSVKALITEPTRLTFILDDLFHNICFGDSLGIIDVAVDGGTVPYTFLWSNGDTTEDLLNLPSGTYQLVVTDSFGCTLSTQAFDIIEPDSLIIDFETANEMGMMSNGWALALPSGGTSPYMYQWDTLTGSQTTALAIGLVSGMYTVTITDDEGCEYMASVFVDRTTSVGDVEEDGIRIYPNPAREWFMIEGVHEDARIEVYSLDGKRFILPIEKLSINQILIHTRNLPPSIYFILIDESIQKVVVANSSY